jgi:uncharacterized protein with HEPN domain
MGRTDDLKRIRDMLVYARKAERLSRGRTRADLERDELFALGMVRAVEVIGEAASRVSEHTRSNYPQVPWPQIAGMRNRLVHGYDKVDLEVLWKTLTKELGPLIMELEKIVPPEQQA